MAYRAIIDASSAILLARVGLMPACCRQFDICMSRPAFTEATVSGRPGAAVLSALVQAQPGIDVLDMPDALPTGRVAADLKALHAGECHTLQHWFGGAARFVIIDDGKGVRVCRRHAIPHINALLCPKILYLTGQMPEERAWAFADRIAAIGRYSLKVRRWAASCEPSDLDFFIDKGKAGG